MAALIQEIKLRKDYLGNEQVDTIYIGGGTPSLLEIEDLRLNIEIIRSCFDVSEKAEITLESNPDDISEGILEKWKTIGINRLSIGIQSFFDEDLKWMNRAHDASQSVLSLQFAVKHFKNLSVDLIYGFPLLTDEKWKANVDQVISHNIPHLSCYALTVEPKTPLHKMIRLHQTEGIDNDKQSDQLLMLMKWMGQAGYEHYEISNFAKPGFRSRHNSSYWQGRKYLGIGPSAHSYDGISRQWNVSNNSVYIESVTKGILPYEKEILTPTQRINEYIMTSLRTIEGLDLNRIHEAPGFSEKSALEKLQAASKKYIDGGLLKRENDHLVLTHEGKLLADGIAADLFF